MRSTGRAGPQIHPGAHQRGVAHGAASMQEKQPLVSVSRNFERAITHTLLVLMAGVALLAAIELAWILVRYVLTPPFFLPEIHELLELFGLLLMVLIGVELLHSRKTCIVRREKRHYNL